MTTFNHPVCKIFRLKQPAKPLYITCIMAFFICIHSLKAQLTSVSNSPAVFVDGFESPSVSTFAYNPGGGVWSFFGGAGFSKNNSGFTSGNPGAPQGQQIMFLQGTGRASRNVSVAQTGFYRIRLQAARRGNMPNQRQNVGIRIDGISLGEIPVLSTSYTNVYSLAIYLTAGNHSIELRATRPVAGDHTAFVDALHLEKLLDWQSTATWGGTRPNSNHTVTIKAGSVVVMNGNMSAKRITVNGQLVAAQNRDITITTHNIMVMGSNALMEMGSALTPYTRKATLTLNATKNDNATANPNMGNNFLGVMGSARLKMHGELKKSWAKLKDDLRSSVRLAEAVTWKAGDQVLVTSNRTSWNQAEKRTIQSVAEGGKLIRFTQTLTHAHNGGVRVYQRGSKTWTADLRAEVGLLTHNIKIQGASSGNATGYGGHIMIMNNGKAYVSGVELYNMGQKAILGRYPFHWHMLGSAGVGQYFKNSSVHKSYNRAITIHGTESTLVENNFCYDHIGHGLFLEDGSERFNVIRKNVVLLSKRPQLGEELTPSDNQFNEVQNRTPSSFWITNPQNTFEDNIAAGTHGTGYWFAFPTRPMGQSANDPRFRNLQPHTLPLISFRGNTAHSCMSGFDIFDQLDANHSIVRNRGWAHNGLHLMEDCLWFANNHAIYTGIGGGGPSDNLIFENNIFVENIVGTMFASYSIVRQSVFVAHSGYDLLPANNQRYAYRVYDGAGQVHNSHFIGWQHPKANLLVNTGAATKHPNHYFTGNTTDSNGTPRCSLPDFNIKPVGDAGANDPLHPRFWSIIIKDVTGGVTKKPNTALVCNHPFVLVGDEEKPANWTNAYRSAHRFALAVLSYPNTAVANFPNIAVTRQKTGTVSKHAYYVLGNGFKETQKLPVIVSEGFEYVYAFEALPSSKWARMTVDDATAGDYYITCFKEFGKLGGLSVTSPLYMPSYNSLAALRNASGSGYYRQANGNLYVKVRATGKKQYYDIRWSSNASLSAIDTDGDQMPDKNEHAAGRHMFDASDLAANFNQTNQFEGWSGSANVSNRRVQGGFLSGTSINNGDAMLINNAYHFRADRVNTIQVRMKASRNVLAQIFFATSSTPGFSGSRVVSANYTGNNSWQTLTFAVGNHGAWINTITDLRLDPVNGVNVAFDIDWIRGACTGCQDGGASPARITKQYIAEQQLEDKVNIYPNPLTKQLFIKGILEGTIVNIFDTEGKLRKKLKYQGFIDVSDLKVGTYFIGINGALYRVIKAE